MLNVENLVHPFQAKPTLAIEEVGDMGLLEPSLLGEPQAGDFPSINAIPERLTKIFLQRPEFHGEKYSTDYSIGLLAARFMHLLESEPGQLYVLT